MPPMPPMLGRRPLQRIGGRAPPPRGRLAGEYKPCHTCAGTLFELRHDILTASVLRVQYPLHIPVQTGVSNWPIAMFFPPDREQIDKDLSALITPLDHFHLFRRVSTSKR